MKEPQASGNFINTNGINLHYIEYKSEGPMLLIMHGLTANAHAFDGLVKVGLSHTFHIISPDLRGRGLSDKPAFNYSIEDHAKDILGLLDHLGIKKVLIAGHSFGGLLSFYMAATYPERIEKLIILDAAAKMNPNTLEMLGPSLARFSQTYPSFEDYLAHIKRASYNTFWDDAMLSYYRADVRDNPDGSVHPRSNLTDIIEVSTGVAEMDWPDIISSVTQPTILINAQDEYTLGEPLLPDELAKETVEMIKDAHYVPVDGNHQTMLYGEGATEIVKAIKDFAGK